MRIEALLVPTTRTTDETPMHRSYLSALGALLIHFGGAPASASAIQSIFLPGSAPQSDFGLTLTTPAGWRMRHLGNLHVVLELEERPTSIWARVGHAQSSVLDLFLSVEAFTDSIAIGDKRVYWEDDTSHLGYTIGWIRDDQQTASVHFFMAEPTSFDIVESALLHIAGSLHFVPGSSRSTHPDGFGADRPPHYKSYVVNGYPRVRFFEDLPPHADYPEMEDRVIHLLPAAPELTSVQAVLDDLVREHAKSVPSSFAPPQWIDDHTAWAAAPTAAVSLVGAVRVGDRFFRLWLARPDDGTSVHPDVEAAFLRVLRSIAF